MLAEPYRSRAVAPGTAHYWSWLFAAAESREPLLGVYALLAEWRALSDPNTELSVAHIKLAWWQEEMQRLAADRGVHPISRHLAALPRAKGVDFAPLVKAAEAAAAHVAGAPVERSADLEVHAGALTAGPLTVAAALAGAPAAGVRDALSALAAAQYLSAAIAQYRREACAGRVLFPVVELLAARIENADLAASEPPAHLSAYLDELGARARQSFADAGQRLPHAERSRLRHVLVLAALGVKHLNSRRSPKAAEFRMHDLYLAWITARRAVRS